MVLVLAALAVAAFFFLRKSPTSVQPSAQFTGPPYVPSYAPPPYSVAPPAAAPTSSSFFSKLASAAVQSGAVDSIADGLDNAFS